MNQNHFKQLFGVLAILVFVTSSNPAFGSVVDYATCPGYPLVACPAGWAEVPIPDNNTVGITQTINVPPDADYFITDVNAWFFVSHTYQGDIRAILTSPAGTSVDLVNRAGLPGCGSFGYEVDNFSFVNQNFFLQKFLLDDSAASVYNLPSVGCPGVNNVAGSWRSHSALSAFNGQSKVGPWKLTVLDMAPSDTGSLVVWGMTIRTEPATPPVVNIAIPDDFACTCISSAVTGTASEPDGTFSNFRLEWAPDSAGPWNLITNSSTPVNGGSLGLIPAAMPEGYAYLRLIASNALGLSSAFSKVIFVDRTHDGAGFVDPTPGQFVGGSVCMDMVTASDNCWASAALAYAPQGGGFTTFFTTTNPAQPFPSWNTGALLDGNYTLRVIGTTSCGNSAQGTVAVTVDNTAPVALIGSPNDCEPLGGIVQIVGTVTDAHLGGWTLQYTGGTLNSWQTISSGNTPVANGLLGSWNTAGLPACGYTLRLLANDSSTVSCFGSNGTEYLVSVEVGSGGGGGSCDVNGDALIDSGDIQPLVDCLVGP